MTKTAHRIAALALTATAGAALAACTAPVHTPANCPAADYAVTASMSISPAGIASINLADPAGGAHRIHWVIAFANTYDVVNYGDVKTSPAGAATVHTSVKRFVGNQALRAYVGKVDGCFTSDMNNVHN